jgi:ABC-type nitrate/sulfonate/bicarbonate transport system permease component
MDYLERNRGPGSSQLAHPELTGALPRQVLGWRPLWLIPAGSVAVLLALWELAVFVGFVDALLFPPPSRIVESAGQLLANGVLTAHIAATGLRVVVGVVTGAGLGMILGIAMGSSPRLRSIVDPLIGALHPVPKIAILPLIMVVFGIGDVSLIIVIATGAFFPMVINTMTGVHQINPTYNDLARLHAVGGWRKMRRITIPAAGPSLMAGLRLSLNTALLITVAVEMIASRKGLGAMIWLSWSTLRTEHIYVAIAVTVAFGLAVNGLLSWVTRRTLPWYHGTLQ